MAGKRMPCGYNGKIYPTKTDCIKEHGLIPSRVFNYMHKNKLEFAEAMDRLLKKKSFSNDTNHNATEEIQSESKLQDTDTSESCNETETVKEKNNPYIINNKRKYFNILSVDDCTAIIDQIGADKYTHINLINFSDNCINWSLFKDILNNPTGINIFFYNPITHSNYFYDFTKNINTYCMSVCAFDCKSQDLDYLLAVYAGVIISKYNLDCKLITSNCIVDNILTYIVKENK